MADNTKIEWTDATWNPITGCAVVSPGCTNCYAMKLAGTRLKNHPSRKGLTQDTKAGPVWTGEVRFNREWLDQPLRWTKPRMIFVCAHGDLFAEGVPDEWINQVFAVMALCPQHTFQVLTKRPERMREYLTGRLLEHRLVAAQVNFEFDLPEGRWPHMPLPNVWLGASVEDQKRADERIPILLDTPAAIRWISAEPLLGPIDLECITVDGDSDMNAIRPERWEVEIEHWRNSGDEDWEASFLDWYGLGQMPAPGPMYRGLDWVVAGGESGANARPMHPDWARALRDQCADAGVPFLFKQWGEWVPQVGAVDGWTIPDDPEISRRDHRDWEEGHWGEPYRPMWGDDRDDDTVSKVGKRYAGRLLDGIEHNGFPEVQPR